MDALLGKDTLAEVVIATQIPKCLLFFSVTNTYSLIFGCFVLHFILLEQSGHFSEVLYQASKFILDFGKKKKKLGSGPLTLFVKLYKQSQLKVRFFQSF